MFLREGASVLMADISLPGLEGARSKISAIQPSHPGLLEHIRCDVSRESDVAAMVSHLDSWGGVVSIMSDMNCSSHVCLSLSALDLVSLAPSLRLLLLNLRDPSVQASKERPSGF